MNPRENLYVLKCPRKWENVNSFVVVYQNEWIRDRMNSCSPQIACHNKVDGAGCSTFWHWIRINRLKPFIQTQGHATTQECFQSYPYYRSTFSFYTLSLLNAQMRWVPFAASIKYLVFFLCSRSPECPVKVCGNLQCAHKSSLRLNTSWGHLLNV